MAGQGYKLFVNSTTLSASDLNTYVQQQTVMVFATTGARDTALSGVLAEGMQCYITGTGGFYYNGSAWVANLTASSTSTLTNKTLTLPIIDNPIFGYTTTATAAGTTTLTSASTYQQYFTGTTTQTVTLPVASTLTLGTSYYINNNSTGIVTVQSSGANTVLALPGNMTAIFTCILTSGTTAASWDADYAGATSITGTGALTFGTAPTLTSAAMKSPREITTISATAATGTINFDVNTQGTLYYTTSAAANFTLNVRGDSGTTLNAVMATGDSLTVTFLNTNGATPYYASAFTIDGGAITPKWQTGSAPTGGNASSIDAYTYAIFKTGSAAFTVFASQTKFA